MGSYTSQTIWFLYEQKVRNLAKCLRHTKTPLQINPITNTSQKIKALYHNINTLLTLAMTFTTKNSNASLLGMM